MRKFDEILNSVSQLLGKKRKAYGDNYERGRDKRGPVCFYLRIEDKVNRIEQLDLNPTQSNDESVEDSLMDIIGYCVNEINYRAEKKNPELIASEPDTEQGMVKCRGKNCYNRGITTKKKMKECLRASLAINPDFSECVWNAKGISNVYK